MAWKQAELVDARRHLHRNPELSCVEHDTAQWIAEQLSDMSLPPTLGQYGAETSVVTEIVGDKPGPTLLWRADIDALPIDEPQTKDYASQRPGAMHACGHDVHTAVGLGIASRIIEAKDRLAGKLVVVFQPAEEGTPGDGVIGAQAMADAGICDGVDAAYALHCLPAIEYGTIGYTKETAWAGSDSWRLTIKGQQTHGAYPQKGIDPIYVAGQIITGLQSIPGRVVDARDACVVSVGSIHAGEAFNVIPETAKLLGLVRTLNDPVRDRALEALRRLIDGCCKSAGADYELSIHRGAKPVINDPRAVEVMLDALKQVAPSVNLAQTPSQMGAEDFSAFSELVPGGYFFLGVGNAAKGLDAPIHSPDFDVDERCLSLATDAFADALIECSHSWKR